MNPDKRNRLLIVAGTAVLVGTIWIAHGFLRELVFRFEFSRHVAYAENFARNFEEHARALLRQVVSLLAAVRYEYERHGGLPAARALLDQVPAHSEVIDHIAINDRSGDLMLVTGYRDFPRVNMADRDYFVFQKNSTGEEPFIAPPVTDRISGKMVFHISYRLRDPDGAFAGVVVADIDPAAFARFYDSVVLGPNGVVALVGLDRIIRARSGTAVQAVGQSLAGSAMWRALEKAPHGTFPQVSIVDREPRVYAYRKVSGYSLVVGVGVSERDALAATAGLRNLTTALAFAATLGVLAIAALIWRQVAVARALARANEAKSQFLARMSHELRTPLNAVLGFSEIIRDLHFGREAIAKYAEYAGDIHASGRYLLDLINEVLDISKIEAGRYELVEEDIDIVAAVAECVAMMVAAVRRSGLTVQNHLDPGMPCLRADRRALRQVLLNLLSNAVKFTPHGGTVTVHGHVDGDGDLVLIVRDTGTGIHKDFLARVTEPFAREPAMVRQKFEGSGLGLAISDRLMKLHGGTLSVDAELGKGTAVSLRFPARRVLPDRRIATS